MLNNEIVVFTTALARMGQRRLLVLEGEEQWCSQQLASLRTLLPGDWLYIGAQGHGSRHCTPGAIRTLLGQEFTHAVFDARDGFDAEALAILAGSLKAGSWLVLLTPGWTCWPERPDKDALRWSNQLLPAPHFVQHFIMVCRQDLEVVHWRQHHPFPLLSVPDAPSWCPVQGDPAPEQQRVLQTLMKHEQGVVVVTAARGRGKSALAGMLVRDWPGRVLVTAPAKAATDVLAQYAGGRYTFCAPDILVKELSLGTVTGYDWLIIDEAAAIPGPILQKLFKGFPRVLMTSTVQGYEGTGRGFLLKFCASVPGLHLLNLNRPIRWAENDPLERFINQLLLFEDDNFSCIPAGECHIKVPEQLAWREAPAQMRDMYRLLSGAHYRTSPLDLRRMMDAPGQHFALVTAQNELAAGALWLVEEGGLDAALSEAVWAGFRRPRGSLVAQSLAAHGGSPEAATLNGLRVSRIAIHPARQRERLGTRLIDRARCYAAGKFDYLSVSFGYTDELWRFWQRNGFTLVRIGSHREASSGCYNAMALLPLNAEGNLLAAHEHQRLCRDARWLQLWIDEKIPVLPVGQTALDDDDWRELAGFAFAHRSPESCTGSLNRLLLACPTKLPALYGWLVERHPVAKLCAQFALSGKKALFIRLRAEVAEGMKTLDAARADYLKEFVRGLQFF